MNCEIDLECQHAQLSPPHGISWLWEVVMAFEDHADVFSLGMELRITIVLDMDRYCRVNRVLATLSRKSAWHCWG